MEINDFEIVWVYVVDSGDWPKKKEDLKTIVDKLWEKAKSVEGIVRYYTPKELEERAGTKAQKADIRVRNRKLKEELDLQNMLIQW